MGDRFPPEDATTPAGDAQQQNDAEPPGIPTWVKAFGIAALVLILLVVVAMFIGIGGPHGPGRHGPAGNVGGDVPLAITEERGDVAWAAW